LLLLVVVFWLLLVVLLLVLVLVVVVVCLLLFLSMSFVLVVRVVIFLKTGTDLVEFICFIHCCAWLSSSFCDFLCCMVFVGLIIWLKRQIAFTENGEGKETLSASDYTLYVRGLPADATKQEITAHFSRLYALDRADWNFPGYCCCCHVWSKKSRLPEDITDRGSLMYDADGNEVMLVQTITYGTTLNIDNTRDDLYLGTWIAECTVIHPNSDLIQEYQKEKLTRIKLKSGKFEMRRSTNPNPKTCINIDVVLY